jgi:hypothetical protein
MENRESNYRVKSIEAGKFKRKQYYDDFACDKNKLREAMLATIITVFQYSKLLCEMAVICEI